MEKLKKSPDFHIHKNDPNEGMKKIDAANGDKYENDFYKKYSNYDFTDGKGGYMSQRATYKIVKEIEMRFSLK